MGHDVYWIYGRLNVLVIKYQMKQRFFQSIVLLFTILCYKGYRIFNESIFH